MGDLASGIGFSLAITAIVVVGTIGAAIFFFSYSKNLTAGSIKNGTTAPATIMKTWDTGTTINDDPVVGFALDVHPQNESAFQVETKQLISRIQIGAFLPGAQVEVVYDPANHKKIKISQMVAAGGAAGMGGGSLTSDAQVQALQQAILAKEQLLEAVRAMGEQAEATILNVADMGIQVGDSASMKKFNLEVRPSSRPSFRAETQAAVGNVNAYKYQTGNTIWVKFNPSDTTQVAIDHA